MGTKRGCEHCNRPIRPWETFCEACQAVLDQASNGEFAADIPDTEA